MFLFFIEKEKLIRKYIICNNILLYIYVLMVCKPGGQYRDYRKNLSGILVNSAVMEEKQAGHLQKT